MDAPHTHVPFPLLHLVDEIVNTFPLGTVATPFAELGRPDLALTKARGGWMLRWSLEVLDAAALRAWTRQWAETGRGPGLLGWTVPISVLAPTPPVDPRLGRPWALLSAEERDLPAGSRLVWPGGGTVLERDATGWRMLDDLSGEPFTLVPVEQIDPLRQLSRIGPTTP